MAERRTSDDILHGNVNMDVSTYGQLMILALARNEKNYVVCMDWETK